MKDRQSLMDTWAAETDRFVCHEIDRADSTGGQSTYRHQLRLRSGTWDFLDTFITEVHHFKHQNCIFTTKYLGDGQYSMD